MNPAEELQAVASTVRRVADWSAPVLPESDPAWIALMGSEAAGLLADFFEEASRSVLRDPGGSLASWQASLLTFARTIPVVKS